MARVGPIRSLLLLIIDWVNATPPPPPTHPYPLAKMVRGSVENKSVIAIRYSYLITARRASVAITGALPVPSHDKIVLPAGGSYSIPWIFVGVSLPSGVGLIFSAKSKFTGEIFLQLANEAAGGSESQFTTPPSGTGTTGYINIPGAATADFAGHHEYDVKVIYPDATPTPDFPSIGDFILTDHASR